jgi:putative phosphoribosyl transferase
MMFLRTAIFHDRRDAGTRLAAALERFKEDKPVILALPRGGVPVAFEVARALSAELDLLLVRKIGAPGHQELAIGAVVDGKDPQLVLNHEIIAHASPPPGYIEAEQKRQLAEIERRRQLYRGAEPPADIKGRTVIVIDDGIATGATMKAALRGIRQNEPQRLILAVPVAPPDTLEDLKTECDEIVCLSAPEFFNAVGSHYADFTQTSDEEVMALLAEAKAQRQGK